jgi:hypothetical protein
MVKLILDSDTLILDSLTRWTRSNGTPSARGDDISNVVATRGSYLRTDDATSRERGSSAGAKYFANVRSNGGEIRSVR